MDMKIDLGVPVMVTGVTGTPHFVRSKMPNISKYVVSFKLHGKKNTPGGSKILDHLKV